jgi:hypothetical protein
MGQIDKVRGKSDKYEARSSVEIGLLLYAGVQNAAESSCFTLARIRFKALCAFAALRDPTNITLTSAAIKKKFHPPAWILRSRVNASGTLTILHSPKLGSHSSPIAAAFRATLSSESCRFERLVA